jgi:hypothetical protein
MQKASLYTDSLINMLGPLYHVNRLIYDNLIDEETSSQFFENLFSQQIIALKKMIWELFIIISNLRTPWFLSSQILGPFTSTISLTGCFPFSSILNGQINSERGVW